MRHDPAEIVSELIQEHGLDRAIEIATEGIISSQRSGDFYALSIWREVRRLLRARREDGT
jgi:hypothetical protein